jgi:hypothetical protein
MLSATTSHGHDRAQAECRSLQPKLSHCGGALPGCTVPVRFAATAALPNHSGGPLVVLTIVHRLRSLDRPIAIARILSGDRETARSGWWDHPTMPLPGTRPLVCPGKNCPLRHPPLEGAVRVSRPNGAGGGLAVVLRLHHVNLGWRSVVKRPRPGSLALAGGLTSGTRRGRSLPPDGADGSICLARRL